MKQIDYVEHVSAFLRKCETLVERKHRTVIENIEQLSKYISLDEEDEVVLNKLLESNK